MDTIKQKQTAKIIQQAMSEILQFEIKEILEGAMVTISGVRITPDLYIAKHYLSIFNHIKPEKVLLNLNANKKAIRGMLGKKIKNKVRSIPELSFFIDDSMTEVFKLEEVLKEIKQKDEEIAKMRAENPKDINYNDYKED